MRPKGPAGLYVSFFKEHRLTPGRQHGYSRRNQEAGNQFLTDQGTGEQQPENQREDEGQGEMP